jgi:hypothetical protein
MSRSKGVINTGGNATGKSTVFRRFGDLVQGGGKSEFEELWKASNREEILLAMRRKQGWHG